MADGTRNFEPVVLKNDVPVTTTLKIAEVFGKRHGNVVRAIDVIKSSKAYTDKGQPNFGLADYIDEQGKAQKCYEATEEGAMLLIMGFTGERALEFKLKFIDETTQERLACHRRFELHHNICHGELLRHGTYCG